MALQLLQDSVAFRQRRDLVCCILELPRHSRRAGPAFNYRLNRDNTAQGSRPSGAIYLDKASTSSIGGSQTTAYELAAGSANLTARMGGHQGAYSTVTDLARLRGW